MKLKVYILCAFLLFTSKSLWAQQPTDPIGENLFPPELVMQYQHAIGLTEDQKNFIKAETRKVQLQFTELHWQLQDEVEAMSSLMKQERVDEQQVLAQLDKILKLEREIKRMQIGLVIRIKNILTPEQQARLQELKNRSKER